MGRSMMWRAMVRWRKVNDLMLRWRKVYDVMMRRHMRWAAEGRLVRRAELNDPGAVVAVG